ncbi:MAG: hypothetical protein ACRCUS_08010 [Anaerovoracaceae bacterium]
MRKLINSSNKPIDVVCHSMGYAHALGVIKVLQDIGLKIGALYCLAPEGAQFTEKNPECMEVLNKIENIIQFGTDENKDPILKRDYIAPQSSIPVSKVIRHYHQVGNIEGIGFLDAHRLKPVFKKEFGADDVKKDDIFSKEIKSRK